MGWPLAPALRDAGSAPVPLGLRLAGGTGGPFLRVVIVTSKSLEPTTQNYPLPLKQMRLPHLHFSQIFESSTYGQPCLRASGAPEVLRHVSRSLEGSLSLCGRHGNCRFDVRQTSPAS